MTPWQIITKYLATASWITKIASWTKVPQLVVLNKIIIILETLLVIAKSHVLRINQQYSDEVIRQTTEAETHIEEERQKPVSQQDNDVLREQARNRHRGSDGNG